MIIVENIIILLALSLDAIGGSEEYIKVHCSTTSLNCSLMETQQLLVSDRAEHTQTVGMFANIFTYGPIYLFYC